MCGEKNIVRKASFDPQGSPPHVRGKACRMWKLPWVLGITPACAGKRISVKPRPACSQDHPRMCGEKGKKIKPGPDGHGSPPHVRGKVSALWLFFACSGITPACAGKRLKRSRSTVPHAAIVPLFPSVCNKPAGSDGSPAGHDAPPFLPIENAAPASPAYNLRSL